MENHPQQELPLPPPWVTILKKYEGVDPQQVLIPDTEAALLLELGSTKTLEDWRSKGVSFHPKGATRFRPNGATLKC